MKEKDLIRAVKAKVSSAVYHHSNTFSSMTSNGIPDSYFDGPERDLWVEWKQIVNWPRDGLVGGVAADKRGCFTPQQYDWMTRRWQRGGNVIGVVGLPDGCAVVLHTPTEWQDKVAWEPRVLGRADVARTITEFCTQGIPCHRTSGSRSPAGSAGY